MPGAGNGNPLQSPCLGNAVNRGAHAVEESNMTEQLNHHHHVQPKASSSQVCKIYRHVREQPKQIPEVRSDWQFSFGWPLGETRDIRSHLILE